MCWEEMVLGCPVLRILGPVCQSPKPTPPPLLQENCTQVRAWSCPWQPLSGGAAPGLWERGGGTKLRPHAGSGGVLLHAYTGTHLWERACIRVCGPRRVLPHLRRQQEPPRFPAAAGRPPHCGARESPGPPFGLQMVMGVGLLDRGEKRARRVPEKGVSGKAYKREPSVAL